MTPNDRPANTMPVLTDAGAELLQHLQTRQIEIRLANRYLVLSRQQARGLLLELATFLTEANSDKTPCVITLD